MNLKSKQFTSIIPGKLTAIEVNGDITSALRIFKKQQKETSVILECFERKFYKKPSDQKRKQLEKAKYLQFIEDNK